MKIISVGRTLRCFPRYERLLEREEGELLESTLRLTYKVVGDIGEDTHSATLICNVFIHCIRKDYAVKEVMRQFVIKPEINFL
ncbi:g355 [Yersinia phage phiR1-37]|uniref:hypothetical protein n=1 Tax=Yersinia phage phiR1-37 TaxID=331278 RepID=UPI00022DBE0E|nr:hypothetical protein phiR1-37_gp355 [Yersinia phage phiR1-37]CCE26378.1 g355 [Yersinia phage phiR1-37]